MATSSLWSASASCALVWLGARLGAEVVVVVVSVSGVMGTGLDGAEFLPSVLSDSPEHQYSTVQYSAVQYSTVQYSTVQYSTVQYSTVQCSTV